MQIIALNKICPGKRHAWYQTDLEFLVRKPVGVKLYKAPFFPPFPKVTNNQQTFWFRFKKWIKNLCRF